MTMVWLLALQTAGATAGAGAGPMPTDFDLAKYRPAEPEPGSCGPSGTDEIVVCGRRRGGGDYPYDEMAAKFRYLEKPLVAEWSIAPNATVRVYGESAEMPAGQISKRAMVGLKVKF
jgi:hypothetical protein